MEQRVPGEVLHAPLEARQNKGLLHLCPGPPHAIRKGNRNFKGTWASGGKAAAKHERSGANDLRGEGVVGSEVRIRKQEATFGPGDSAHKQAGFFCPTERQW